MSPAVLFLDVDGVLNCTEFYKRVVRETGKPARALSLCRDRMALLNEVVERTSCLVTVSSTWRRGKNCRRVLRDRGFKGRFSRDWRTDWLQCFEKPDLVRGDEIADWLARNGSPRYAIVDDDSDMLEEQQPFFVQTSHETGLQRGHVERLVSLLSAATRPPPSGLAAGGGV